MEGQRAGETHAFKLISLNVNGIRAAHKRRAVFSYLHKLQADIVLLQETHCTEKDQKIWLSEWGGKGFFSNGRSNARGVCTLFQRNFNPKITKQVADTDGRLLVLQFERKEVISTVFVNTTRLNLSVQYRHGSLLVILECYTSGVQWRRMPRQVFPLMTWFML